MRRSILIVTGAVGDVHADVAAGLLRRRGHDPVFLIPEEIPSRSSVSVRLDGSTWSGSVHAGEEFGFDEIRAVWWRKPQASHFSPELPKGELEHARLETRHTLQGLWQLIENGGSVWWMSHPRQMERASYKIGQMNRAAQLGFRIPKTLVTNDPEQVRAFYDECGGRIIYKSMTKQYLSSPPRQPEPGEAPFDYIMYSAVVTAENLKNIGDSIALNPCLFQELIPKRLELRVTVIGDTFFTAEIHSQTREETLIDWRKYQVEIPHTVGKLPGDLEAKCLQMMREYDLSYSAFDFIVTPDGEYVFLENNPGGQYMFIEQYLPEMKMTEKLVDTLIDNAG